MNKTFVLLALIAVAGCFSAVNTRLNFSRNETRAQNMTFLMHASGSTPPMINESALAYMQSQEVLFNSGLATLDTHNHAMIFHSQLQQMQARASAFVSLMDSFPTYEINVSMNGTIEGYGLMKPRGES